MTHSVNMLMTLILLARAALSQDLSAGSSLRRSASNGVTRNGKYDAEGSRFLQMVGPIQHPWYYFNLVNDATGQLADKVVKADGNSKMTKGDHSQNKVASPSPNSHSKVQAKSSRPTQNKDHVAVFKVTSDRKVDRERVKIRAEINQTTMDGAYKGSSWKNKKNKKNKKNIEDKKKKSGKGKESGTFSPSVSPFPTFHPTSSPGPTMSPAPTGSGKMSKKKKKKDPRPTPSPMQIPTVAPTALVFGSGAPTMSAAPSFSTQLPTTAAPALKSPTSFSSDAPSFFPTQLAAPPTAPSQSAMPTHFAAPK